MKLHLGCGNRYLSGYAHIDLADYPHIDYKQDITITCPKIHFFCCFTNLNSFCLEVIF